MERIIGIDGNGNYIYEDNGQLDQEIQKATNENFLDMIGEEDTGDKLISLNEACTWWRTYLPFIYLTGMNKTSEHKIIDRHIENFKKAMKNETRYNI